MGRGQTEGAPVGEEQVGGDGVQVGEESRAGSQSGAGLLPDLVHAVADRMEGKGQQIHHHKELGWILLAAPEVIFSDLGDSSLIFLLRIWTPRNWEILKH